METVGKFVTALVALVLVGTGLYYAVRFNFRYLGTGTLSSVALESSQPAAGVGATSSAPAAVAPDPNLFDESGTILYYVQQGVEVPYLFYMKRGAPYTKALTFTGESICVTSVQSPCAADIDALKSEYGSGPVEAQGTVDDESLIVTRLSAAPV